jgi:ferredoxin
MSVKKLDSNRLAKWVDACIATQRVFGVQAKDGRFAFDALENADALRLDYDVTLLPPKKYFLPQKETLLKFDRESGFESVLDNEPFVLFGVHPYDLEAILQTDLLFSKDHRDTHYAARRENAVIVASDVESVSPGVFAGSMGTAVIREGFDILLTRVGDGYLADIRTEKGEALAASLEDCPDADDTDLKLREHVWKSNEERLRRHRLNVPPAELPELLEQSAEHPVWEEKARRCYSCGSCNLVCPTCYCFDVRDETDWDLKHGRRVRSWDGCLLSEFALVAGGHNFRRSKADRYRHRYYRKGKYVFDQIGRIACVGCGRCITACTANIANPVEVYNKLKESST